MLGDILMASPAAFSKSLQTETNLPLAQLEDRLRMFEQIVKTYRNSLESQVIVNIMEENPSDSQLIKMLCNVVNLKRCHSSEVYSELEDTYQRYTPAYILFSILSEPNICRRLCRVVDAEFELISDKTSVPLIFSSDDRDCSDAITGLYTITWNKKELWRFGLVDNNLSAINCLPTVRPLPSGLI
jgi:hypothetical protein